MSNVFTIISPNYPPLMASFLLTINLSRFRVIISQSRMHTQVPQRYFAGMETNKDKSVIKCYNKSVTCSSITSSVVTLLLCASLVLAMGKESFFFFFFYVWFAISNTFLVVSCVSFPLIRINTFQTLSYYYQVQVLVYICLVQ